LTKSTAPLPAASIPLSQDAPSSCFIDPLGDELIRRDLHGSDHLETLARQLAEVSVPAPPWQRSQPLLRNFVRMGSKLRHAHQQIRAAFRRQENTGPETEWLLDNFHIVEESLQEVRQDLPQGYYAKLPKLASGPLAGYPCVYAFSLTLVAHTDSGLDEDHIQRFVQAYQSVTPLTIGELWAVPIMLRLALLENLRRLSKHILIAWQDRLLAGKLLKQVERFTGTAARPGADAPVLDGEQLRQDASSLLLQQNAWQRFFCSHPRCDSDPFLVQLLQMLRDHPALGQSGIDFLQRHLQKQGMDTDHVLRRESQRQARNQVCVGNCVTSLRVLSAQDWNVFFEKVSPVDAVLREDPAGVYACQDFATRDRYRQVIEKLARGSNVRELEIARDAIKLARRSKGLRTRDSQLNQAFTSFHCPQSSATHPAEHVGYYLLGQGSSELAGAIAYRPHWKNRLLDTVRAYPHAMYFGAIGVFLTLFLALVLTVAVKLSASVPVLILLGLAALLPASELASGLVNYLLTVLLPPRVLPKLDFRRAFPPSMLPAW